MNLKSIKKMSWLNFFYFFLWCASITAYLRYATYISYYVQNFPRIFSNKTKLTLCFLKREIIIGDLKFNLNNTSTVNVSLSFLKMWRNSCCILGFFSYYIVHSTSVACSWNTLRNFILILEFIKPQYVAYCLPTLFMEVV